MVQGFSAGHACTQGGGGMAQGLGIRLFAFGGAYWPLATAREGGGMATWAPPVTLPPTDPPTSEDFSSGKK